MREVSLFEAKTHLSGLVNEIINNHQEIAITKHGHPVILMTLFSDSPKPDFQKAISTIQELRASLPALSIHEILDMREEGRRVCS
ncbi:MAG: type II toxin-antitoxin system Phd/YefM family antitoxin [Myxococcaceae bacterium]